MHRKYRIAILGMGGVGGFIGGRLAAAYTGSSEAEIIFIARGAHAQAIRKDGLRLITSEGEMTVRPDRVSDGTDDIGELDVLICCTKAYGLEGGIRMLSSAIIPETFILPLLNGVDCTERIRAIAPDAKVLEGCIYLVSKILAPGTVQQRGDFYALHFGGDSSLSIGLQKLLALFTDAGINAILEERIREKVWAKFSFISPIATYTSAYDISIGRILESEEHTAALKKLGTELLTLANALGIHLPADTIEKNFAVMAKLPYETTSSMHADFAANRPTELETLTGFVIRKAAEQGIRLEAYPTVYEKLNGRYLLIYSQFK